MFTAHGSYSTHQTRKFFTDRGTQCEQSQLAWKPHHYYRECRAANIVLFRAAVHFFLSNVYMECWCFSSREAGRVCVFFFPPPTKTPRKAFAVMLYLQFHHIIHAAMECHLIIECHLLCYKWKPVSDIITDTWMSFCWWLILAKHFHDFWKGLKQLGARFGPMKWLLSCRFAFG